MNCVPLVEEKRYKGRMSGYQLMWPPKFVMDPCRDSVKKGDVHLDNPAESSVTAECQLLTQRSQQLNLHFCSYSNKHAGLSLI